jgi:hypothetical protein
MFVYVHVKAIYFTEQGGIAVALKLVFGGELFEFVPGRLQS